MEAKRRGNQRRKDARIRRSIKRKESYWHKQLKKSTE